MSIHTYCRASAGTESNGCCLFRYHHGPIFVRVSCTIFALPCTVPFTLHPVPYTLHPVPYILYPVPDTLYPLPCPLYPVPFIRTFDLHPVRILSIPVTLPCTLKTLYFYTISPVPCTLCVLPCALYLMHFTVNSSHTLYICNRYTFFIYSI